KWKNEKESINHIGILKKDLEALKIEADTSERNADYGRVAELRYGMIPELERQLSLKEQRLKRTQISRRILKEEITEEDIAAVVSKWTDIPVSKMLEGEMEKLMKM
ncbi:MAG: type VI secretion system ATPase TssH, partial [Patescibacteria group bacterium]